jgi:serine O-acetyltransferase
MPFGASRSSQVDGQPPRPSAGHEGVLIKGHARHPIIEDDVVMYAGATVLGRITSGRGSTIGGNVWLTHRAPPPTHVTQAAAQHALFAAGAGI